MVALERIRTQQTERMRYSPVSEPGRRDRFPGLVVASADFRTDDVVRLNEVRGELLSTEAKPLKLQRTAFPTIPEAYHKSAYAAATHVGENIIGKGIGFLARKALRGLVGAGLLGGEVASNIENFIPFFPWGIRDIMGVMYLILNKFGVPHPWLGHLNQQDEGALWRSILIPWMPPTLGVIISRGARAISGTS